MTACVPATPIPPPTPGTQTITIYFLDQNKFSSGEQPFEVAVTREIHQDANPIMAVLDAYFAGPTAEEASQGLVAIYSGFSGVRDLQTEDGIAYLYLEGQCQSMGAAYNIASLLIKNLTQFDEIQYVKIFDENGETENPEGPSNSIPGCLQP
ncbi:MAG: GerMN domain-containing protein [Chloroflexi bacterium]|nr:GerMN domain-containing protein [Chloroflexota bacterium]